jgi:hypothetical protein
MKKTCLILCNQITHFLKIFFYSLRKEYLSKMIDLYANRCNIHYFIIDIKIFFKFQKKRIPFDFFFTQKFKGTWVLKKKFRTTKDVLKSSKSQTITKNLIKKYGSI